MRPVQSLSRGLGLASLVVVLDQLTKWLILTQVMQPPRVIEVTPFFNLVMTWNRGVSFGMFNGDSPYNAWVLPLVAMVIAVVLVIWLARSTHPLMSWGLGLIIGGAIGNLIDRLRFGAVADFLDVHAAGWHWPAFNVADAAITIGVVVLIGDSLFGSATHRKRNQMASKEAGE